MANEKLKAGNKKKKKRKNSDKLKAGIPDDLYYDPKSGVLRQKYDDNGHPSERWLEILSGRRMKA